LSIWQLTDAIGASDALFVSSEEYTFLTSCFGKLRLIQRRHKKVSVKHDADDDNDGGADTILPAKIAMQKPNFIGGVTLSLLPNAQENLLRVDCQHSQSRPHASVNCPAMKKTLLLLVFVGLLAALYYRPSYHSYHSTTRPVLSIACPAVLHHSSCHCSPATQPIPIPR
jgi:hypothetical protein